MQNWNLLLALMQVTNGSFLTMIGGIIRGRFSCSYHGFGNGMQQGVTKVS